MLPPLEIHASRHARRRLFVLPPLLLALAVSSSPLIQGFTPSMKTCHVPATTAKSDSFRQRTRCGASETTDDIFSVVAPSDEDELSTRTARAGMDGYSLMRQPLSRENWNPQVDPNYEVPDRLDENSGEQQDQLWWSDRSNIQRRQGQKMQSDTGGGKSGSRNGTLGETLDLFQRSVDTLDFPYVLKALREECFTSPGRKIVEEATSHMVAKGKNNDQDQTKRKRKDLRAYQPLLSDTVEGANQRYAAVQEMQWLLATPDEIDLGEEPYWKNRRGYKVTLGGGNPPPLEGLSFDLEAILEIADKGEILEGPEILEISTFLNAMEDIQLWSQGLKYIDTTTVSSAAEQQVRFVELPNIVSDIHINVTLQDLLSEAFDKDGKLSGTTFPVLGRLRAKVRTLKSDILQTLDSLVKLPSIQKMLALESGGPLYSEIGNGGRLVLPIDPKYASSIGIVHDSSRSGKTVFVEPSEIVGPTNELRQAEGELRAEEARVWRSLTEQILRNRRDLEQSIRAVGQLDLVLARCMLGQKLGSAVIPDVQDEGIISLRDAKHPVLLLRKIANVVGSDVDLGSNGNQGLVLTGPNSGGKTVILKLLGMVALMARSGIPVPAAAENFAQGSENGKPRVDFFDPVLADIGDLQSVDGDLSTFSGHMLVCREVLANSGKSALVLMDELGSGTDPAQGVAIAQAILEALVDTGCRVAITTHYMELKQLAASDSRFSVGGMQFVKGQPTYKLLPGTVGESFAMAVAERLKLPQSVIDRATSLLDSETRQMGDLIRELEDQKALVDEQVEELENKKRELAALEIEMKEDKIKLERKMLDARRVEARKFAKQLEEKEEILENILERLKSDPSRKVLAKSWDDIKFVRRDALNEAENVPSVVAAKNKAAKAEQQARAELVPLAELREKPELNPGDKLIVCKAGPLFGREAIVEKVLGKRLEANVSGMKMALKMTEVAMMTSGIAIPVSSKYSPAKSGGKGKQSNMSKAADKALMEEGRQRQQPQQQDGSNSSGGSLMMRTESNTVDVRGCNLEEAKERAKAKFSQCIMSGRSAVYILHGHGTGGVLKAKIRGWLKSESQLVKRWKPAEASDGGDAFTVVELR